MKVATGKIVDGKVVLEGEPLAEGSGSGCAASGDVAASDKGLLHEIRTRR